jgi:DNA-binding transcriptional MocR family regulator
VRSSQLGAGGLGSISAARLAELLSLDRDRCGSVEIAARLRRLVADGRVGLAVGLPAERVLAARLGVSRGMVTAAYMQLRRDGWADARQGAGTWTTLPDRDVHAAPYGGAWAPDAGRDDVLDLAHAAPSAPLQLAPAFAAALDALPRHLPGHGYHPAGLPELRARIAERYSTRGLRTVPEQVLVTSGALHGITLVVEGLARRGDRVLVEHPTYPNALAVVRARGARLVEASVAPADAFADAAAEIVRSAQPALAYLMPDVHNPTGRVLDPRAAEQLAAALSAARTAVIVDETLADLQLDDLPAASPDTWLDAVHIGSLSKSVWGGLRIGWLRGRTELIRTLTVVAARTSLSGPVVEQLAACHLLDVLDEVLTARRIELRERRDLLRATLVSHLSDWDVPLPPAGLSLWCRLPDRRSSTLALAAEQRGLRLAPGPLFGTGSAFEDRLRIPFTLPSERLQRAVEILAEVDSSPHPTTRARLRSTETVV